MATYIGDLGGERKRPLFARRLSLGPGEKTLALRKNRRRRVLRTPHILALIALQAAFFLAVRAGLSSSSSPGTSWPSARSRSSAPRTASGGRSRRYFAVPRLGNILLCDLEAVRAQVRRLAWVKDASVQKVFPSGLRISVVERAPFALLERDGLLLADEEGHALEPVYSLEEYALPVISDEAGFASGFTEKWEAASRCFKSLPQAERERLDSASDAAITGRSSSPSRTIR